ncbi:TPA: hypothetical protein ACNZ6B_004770, partial [Klebsiella quasipneumoniae]
SHGGKKERPRSGRFSIGSAPLTSITETDAQISGGETRQDYKDIRRFPLMGADGESIAPLKLSDLGTGPKVLFAFQHWCRGCHLHGFPTLQRLHGALSAKGVGFAVIQTVFEGADENTFEKLRVNQLKYALPVAFGQDEPPAGATLPTFMEDYRTRGTPWFSVMDAGGRIVFSDFHLDADQLVKGLELV